jgi:hypothetical protein
MNSPHRASITNGAGISDSAFAAAANAGPRRSTAHSLLVKALFEKDGSANIILPTLFCKHCSQFRHRIPWLVMLSLLAVLLVRILEGMFVVGLFGSTLVLLITFVEDIETLVGREESHHS